MKLDFDNDPAVIRVAAYGAGWIRIGEQRIAQPCVISAAGISTTLLPAAPTALEQRHLAQLAALAPEIILLGTGARQIFLDADFTRYLAARGIGLEVMDTGAACRSYNILAGEGRPVVAALFML